MNYTDEYEEFMKDKYLANERKLVIQVFTDMLKKATGDGSKKRAAGTKPPWWRDESHEAAMFSHLNKWKHGEQEDPDSGAHPLVHLAWRALAIAYQETYGQNEPSAWESEQDEKKRLEHEWWGHVL